jgi:acyl carrier protein
MIDDMETPDQQNVSRETVAFLGLFEDISGIKAAPDDLLAVFGDSMDLIDLVNKAESRLKVEVMPSVLARCKTVNDLILALRCAS